MTTNICRICNTQFEVVGNRKFCSDKCGKINRNNVRRKSAVTVNCCVCNTPFLQTRKDKITCHSRCSDKLWIKNNPEKNWLRYNSDIAKSRKKKWLENNRDLCRARTKRYKKKVRLNNPIYRLYESIGNLIRNSVKRTKHYKKNRTTEILGCSIQTFKLHIESKFEPWMNWKNYGKYEYGKLNFGWDIDHIIPVSTANSEEELIKLNHYTNLQPLCSMVNRHIKSDKIPLDFQKSTW